MTYYIFKKGSLHIIKIIIIFFWEKINYILLISKEMVWITSGGETFENKSMLARRCVGLFLVLNTCQKNGRMWILKTKKKIVPMRWQTSNSQ